MSLPASITPLSQTFALVVTAGSAASARPPNHAAPSAKKKATPVLVVVGDTMGVTGSMTMTVTPASVAAGRIKFTVQNTGTILHEMVILKTDLPYDQIPVAKDVIDDSKSIIQISNIPKGKSKSKTVKLKAGNYVLACNIDMHYALGMRAAFTVT